MFRPFRTWVVNCAFVTCIAFSPLFAVPGQVLAEETPPRQDEDLTELSLDQLTKVDVAMVYGASKFEQKVTEAPSAVSIVTADEIKKYGYRTLADILRSQRGFYVTYDRNYEYIGSRGVDRSGGYDSRILVLVDGHRTNENMYDAAFVGNDFILDVDLIDRVEIIRGPGSSLYGDNAFFAVVNIFTRHGKKLQGAELSGEAGSLSTYSGRASYGTRLDNGLDLSFSASLLDSQGRRKLYYPEYDDAAHNYGVARNADYENNYRLFSTASFRDFTLQGAYSSREKGVPTASFGATFDDSRFKTVDSRGYLDLKYQHTFGEDWDTTARAYYDYYNYHENIPFDSDSGGSILNRDTALNKWWGTELKVSRTFWEKHHVVAGSEYQSNTTQLFYNHDIEPRYDYLKVDRPTWRWASYFQDEFTIVPNFILNAGVRYDFYNTFGGTVNPRAGLIYTPVPGSSIKALYGEAFRAPNSYELYYDVAEFQQKGNPELKPEKIRSYELVWEQGWGEHVRSTLAGFYNKISNMIKQQTDPGDGMLVFQNVDVVTAKGVEAELESKWKSGVEGRVSYTLQDARDDRTGLVLVDSPQHMAKLNFIAPLYRKSLFSGIELQYLGSRKTLAGKRVDGYLVTNLTLFSHDLVPGVELSGTLYNLFDKQYGIPGGGENKQDVIGQDGRTFRVKLSYRF